MRTKYTSSRDLDVKIKQLELDIAKLQLTIAEKEKHKEELQEIKLNEIPLATDRREHPIFAGSIVKVLTPSSKVEFKGVKNAVVIGKSKSYPRRIVIGKIGNEEIVTTREPHNVLMLENSDDSRNRK